MYLSTRVLVFSDFNCPYCYLLNEWLEHLGLGKRVRWVGVEYRPELPTAGSNRPPDVQQVSEEVSDAQTRDPSVPLEKPPLWCSSGLALRVQAAIEDDDPERAPQLRTLFFRALWRDGRNIADPDVVDAILSQAGLPNHGAILLDAEIIVDQTKWWKGELDRIPSMVAPTGIRHMGLQTMRVVKAFVQSALNTASPGQGCQ